MRPPSPDQGSALPSGECAQPAAPEPAPAAAGPIPGPATDAAHPHQASPFRARHAHEPAKRPHLTPGPPGLTRPRAMANGVASTPLTATFPDLSGQ